MRNVKSNRKVTKSNRKVTKVTVTIVLLLTFLLLVTKFLTKSNKFVPEWLNELVTKSNKKLQSLWWKVTKVTKSNKKVTEKVTKSNKNSQSSGREVTESNKKVTEQVEQVTSSPEVKDAIPNNAYIEIKFKNETWYLYKENENVVWTKTPWTGHTPELIIRIDATTNEIKSIDDLKKLYDDGKISWTENMSFWRRMSYVRFASLLMKKFGG